MNQDRRMRILPGMLLCIITAAPAAYAADPIVLPEAAWTYDEDYTGQEEWSRLSPDFAVCQKGTMQSPINIGDTKIADLPLPEFRYKPSAFHVESSRKMLRAVPADGGMLADGGELYQLSHIDFHSPAEHMHRHDFSLLEIQLVHKGVRGNWLIVSVMADPGEAHPVLSDILAPAPEQSVMLDASGFLPAGRGYFAYTGSLTTPPCTEGVEWRIMKMHTHVSHEQLAAIGRIVGRNARLTQPVYLRTVNESSE